MESVVAGEFGVESRQQVPPLTERDHSLGDAFVGGVGCGRDRGRGTREQRFGNAGYDFDGWLVVRRREEFRNDLLR